MGFARGTATTADSDIFAVAFEQEITNVLREAGETDLSKLHIAANDFMLRSFPVNVNPALVVNTYDFKYELIYWMLMTIYRGEEPDQTSGKQLKRDEYKKEWQAQKDSRRFIMTDGSILGDDGKSSGLPMMANVDSGPFFPGTENSGVYQNDITRLVRDPFSTTVNNPRQ